MYTEEYEKRKFSFRKFLIRLIILVVIILVGIWLYNEFYKPSQDEFKTPKNCRKEAEITDNKIKENGKEIKKIILEYFELDMIPEKEKQSVSVSFQELTKIMKMKTLYDERGIAYLEDSYVRLEKRKKDYLVQIVFRTRDKEQCISFILEEGNCDTFLCEQGKPVEKQTKEKVLEPEEEKPTEEKSIHPNRDDENKEPDVTIPNTSTSDKYDHIIISEEKY